MFKLKRKNLLAVVLVFGVMLAAKGQQYPVFTQYYFNELVINPAYAGSHVQLSVNTTYRNQWVNFPGAPRTYLLSGHNSFYKGRIGVGLLINHDEIGSYSNENIYGSYAYRLNFAKSTFSMGIQAGFNILGADFSHIDLRDLNDASFASLSSLKPNFGAGLFYNRKNFFVGLSVPFILNNGASTSFEGLINEIKERRYYFLRMGTIVRLGSTGDVKFNPSILLRSQEGQPLSLDVNTAFIFYDLISTGVSIRTSDALILFIDLKLSERFHFAYSYDVTSSGLNNFSNGSHEFMLNFRTRIRGIHKNLECPSYYSYR